MTTKTQALSLFGDSAYEQHSIHRHDVYRRRVRDGGRPRPQLLGSYACWNLTARSNLAFIADQLGHSDYSMLVKVYARWIDSESPRELERIWAGMQNMAKNIPNLLQKLAA